MSYGAAEKNVQDIIAKFELGSEYTRDKYKTDIIWRGKNACCGQEYEFYPGYADDGGHEIKVVFCKKCGEIDWGSGIYWCYRF